MDVRTAQLEDVHALATIWYDGWRDAHLELVPAEVAEARTLDSLRERLTQELSEVRTVGEIASPLGFSMTKADELNQLYVASAARGTGVAQALINEFEVRLAGQGVGTAWLACAIGNDRGARFYEKSGWHLARTFVAQLELKDGIFPLEVWRYEKQIT